MRIFLLWLCTFTLLSAKAQVRLIDINSREFHPASAQVNSIWHFREKGKLNWLPAKVPGTVHTDLLDNKAIPDPYYATNEDSVQWVSTKEWEYQTVFTLSKNRFSEIQSTSATMLLLNGLDTYASVYLNDSLILEADNMFRTWTLPVKTKLKQGKNKLYICFHPVDSIEKHKARRWAYTLPGDQRVFTRKAAYQYGWDWGPRMITSGIWRPIQLQLINNITATDLHYQTQLLSKSEAKMIVHGNLQVQQPGKYRIQVRADGYLIRDTLCEIDTAIHKFKIPFVIKHPRLWWSHDMGTPALYKMKLDIQALDRPAEKYENMTKIGVRTVEWRQQEDQYGKSFYLVLNGKPVFCRGANYVPPDNMMPRVSKAKYRKLLLQAKQTNANMLRIWGGGVYEDDYLYTLADSLGLLVWQDMMFAGAMYPSDVATIQNIEAEIHDNVNRLQSHPSIVLWCGNNEIDEAWHNWGWQKQYSLSSQDSTQIWNGYLSLFHHIIPTSLKAVMPEAFYWPSSPSVGWGRRESLLQGDCHYWGVWWGGEPFSTYKKKVGRFMSEYGFQSMPNWESIRKYTPVNDTTIGSPTMKVHQKHPTGWQTIAAYMEKSYGVPSQLQNYQYVSQLLQARGMTVAIQAHRMAKPYCMGTLYWQLNDCWPVTSWSSTDYYLQPKALYYTLKNVFSPVLLAFDTAMSKLQLKVVSDLSQAKVRTQTTLRIQTLSGQEVYAQRLSNVVKSDSSQLLTELDMKQIIHQYGAQNIVASAVCEYEGKQTPIATFYWVEPRFLPLQAPKLQTSYITQKGKNYLILKTDILVKDVALWAEGATFSQNYFDLLPGEEKWISYAANHPLKHIQIQTLNDLKL